MSPEGVFILIVCPNKYQEITNTWSISEWLHAYIKIFFGKFEIGVEANIVRPYISKPSLLYNRGKTDGLMHTFGVFVPKVLGLESHCFAGEKLCWMVNSDNNLVAIR